MQKPILLCVQPYIIYYAWQVEVMLHNFISLGIPKDFDVHILLVYNELDSNHDSNMKLFKKLEDGFKIHYPNTANFYYYADTRQLPNYYISALRPNALKQHYAVFPELKERVVFYHDCDVLFTKYPQFIFDCMQDDSNWYVSDTVSYIGHQYILSKGQDVMDKMCEIVGIPEELVKAKQKESGGAQYILKGVDASFWEKVEIDCERLFVEITNFNNEKKKADPTHHELQIWCADMWSILWNAWLHGFNTNIIPEMDFCWATDNISRWDNVYIYHNAGATGQAELFYKYEFVNKLPYALKGRDYDKTLSGYRYFEIVQEYGRKTLLSTMSKAKEILLAYANLVNPTEEQQKLAEKRLSICTKCDFFGEAIVDYCKECGCPLKGKIFSPNQYGCRIGKWVF